MKRAHAIAGSDPKRLAYYLVTTSLLHRYYIVTSSLYLCHLCLSTPVLNPITSENRWTKDAGSYGKSPQIAQIIGPTIILTPDLLGLPVVIELAMAKAVPTRNLETIADLRADTIITLISIDMMYFTITVGE